MRLGAPATNRSATTWKVKKLASKGIKKLFSSALAQCQKNCPHFCCTLHVHTCERFISYLELHIVDWIDKEYLVIKFLDGKYKVTRLDALNLLIEKLVEKEERTVKGKKVGGGLGYRRTGYHSNLTDAIQSIFDDAVMDEVGDAELVELTKFKKNILKLRKALREDVVQAKIKLEKQKNGKAGRTND